MRKLLLKILTGALSLALLVSGLVACGSSSGDWSEPTLQNWGEGSVVGGFIGETENYVYFINGMGDSTSDNDFGAPLKGALMVQDKKELAKENPAEPQVAVPKLIVSEDYNAGIYIYDGYVYYGTPSTDKNSSGDIANNELVFTRTKLNGTDSETFFTIEGLATEFRIIKGNDAVYIVYYDTANTALYSYNTATKEKVEIAKTDATKEGKNAVSLDSYKFLDNNGVKEGFAVAYTVTVYDEEYYESKAQEEGYTRATKNYNEVYVYGVFGDKVESKKILDGAQNNGSVTYAFHLEKGADLYATATDNKTSIVKNFVYNIKSDEAKKVVNMDVIAAESLILNDGKVITVSDTGVVKMRNAFDDKDNANQKVIAKKDSITSLIRYEEETKTLYYYNTTGSICKIETEKEDANEVVVSEDVVSRAWYAPQFITIDGKLNVFYLDSTTKGASYVKYVDLSQETLAKDTDDDGKKDKFYIEGQKFLAKRTNKDIAAYVTAFVNDIAADVDSDGALKFETDSEGKLYVETINKAKAILDAQPKEVKELIGEVTTDTLDQYIYAVKMANVYNALKEARNFAMLDQAGKTALKDAYDSVKAEIQAFVESDNYATISKYLGNDLNAHYSKCVSEFEEQDA